MSDLKGEDRMLIDGRLVAAATGANYHNIYAATEEIIGVTADGGPRHGGSGRGGPAGSTRPSCRSITSAGCAAFANFMRR